MTVVLAAAASCPQDNTLGATCSSSSHSGSSNINIESWWNMPTEHVCTQWRLAQLWSLPECHVNGAVVRSWLYGLLLLLLLLLLLQPLLL
jgi:hypothetical protein